MAGVLIPSSRPGGIDPGSWLGLVLRATGANSSATGAASSPRPCPLDAADVPLAQRGDGDAFERIVRRHQHEIARRLRRFAGGPVMLEELMQETFVQAYLGLARYRGDAPLIHWLHRIAVRAAYRRWKAERARPVHRSLDGAEHRLCPEPARDAAPLEDVLDKLSARDRMVLTLLYLEDRSVAEAAVLLGWSRTMVKVQAFRARARLRKLMVQRDE